MGRPIIGITGELDAARWGDWLREAVISPVSYIRAVDRSGERRWSCRRCRRPRSPPTSPRVDGLVFAGGRDLDPANYDQQRGDETDEPEHRRDRFELALMRAALEAGRPVPRDRPRPARADGGPRRHAHPGPARPPNRPGPLPAARRRPRPRQLPRRAARHPGHGAGRAPPGPVPARRGADGGRLVARRRGDRGARGRPGTGSGSASTGTPRRATTCGCSPRLSRRRRSPAPPRPRAPRPQPPRKPVAIKPKAAARR